MSARLTARRELGPLDLLGLLGALALIIYLLHAGNHLRRGTPQDLLWICNLATALLALGCLARRPMLCAIPLLWLSAGTPLWLLDVLSGGDLMTTGVLTHLGGPVIGALAVRRLGMPRGAWYRALAAAAVIVAISRLATAPEHNVNLAYAVRAGWESRFGDHLLYLGLLFAVAGAVMFAVERLAAWLGRPAHPAHPAPRARLAHPAPPASGPEPR